MNDMMRVFSTYYSKFLTEASSCFRCNPAVGNDTGTMFKSVHMCVAVISEPKLEKFPAFDPLNVGSVCFIR